MTPKDHPVNSSLITSSISISNWFVEENEDVVGIPVVPPIATVSVSPFPYPYPVFLISKSITLDPCPTTISTVAALPIPAEPETYM